MTDLLTEWINEWAVTNKQTNSHHWHNHGQTTTTDRKTGLSWLSCVWMTDRQTNGLEHQEKNRRK